MKRIFTLALVTLALAAVAPAALQAAGDAKGPPCSDINGITTSYIDNLDGTFTFAAQLFLGPSGTTAPCQNITYTTYIVTDPGATPIPVTGTIDQDGNLVFGPVSVTDDDPQIQIYSTSDRNGRILDRAPDDPDYLVVDATLLGGKAPYG